MSGKSCVRWFDDIRLKDVPAVGGKTASLGELYSLLGARVPEGFALTAAAYRARSPKPVFGRSCADYSRISTITM